MPVPIRFLFLPVVLSVAFGGAGCGLLWAHPETIETIGVVGAGIAEKALEELPGRTRIDDVEEGRISKNVRDVLEVTPESVDFGEVDATAPAQREIAVANPRTFAVTILRAHIVGPCFAVAGTSFPITVAPGRTTSIPVVLEARAGSTCEARLILVIDAPGGRYAQVRLRGLVRPSAPA